MGFNPPIPKTCINWLLQWRSNDPNHHGWIRSNKWTFKLNWYATLVEMFLSSSQIISNYLLTKFLLCFLFYFLNHWDLVCGLNLCSLFCFGFDKPLIVTFQGKGIIHLWYIFYPLSLFVCKMQSLKPVCTHPFNILLNIRLRAPPV